jgi:hypothetical protein
MVVQVPTVWTLLDVAVLREVLHPDPHVNHRLATVLAVQAGLGETDAVSHKALNFITLVKVIQTKTMGN